MKKFRLELRNLIALMILLLGLIFTLLMYLNDKAQTYSDIEQDYMRLLKDITFLSSSSIEQAYRNEEISRINDIINHLGGFTYLHSARLINNELTILRSVKFHEEDESLYKFPIPYNTQKIRTIVDTVEKAFFYSDDRNYITSVYPIPFRDRTNLIVPEKHIFLIITLDIGTIKNNSMGDIFQAFWLDFSFVILLSFLTWVVLKEAVVKNIYNLLFAIDNYRLGNKKPVKPEGPQEIYELGKGFNNLIEIINSYLNKLKESEANLNSILENTKDGIYKFDRIERRFTYVSPSLLKMFNTTKEELDIGGQKTLIKNLHPDDAHRVNEKLENYEEQFDKNLEYRFYVKGEGYRWFSSSRTLIKDEEGNLSAVIGVVRDVTEEKELQKELSDSKNLLEKIYANLDEVIILVDPNGRRIVECNHAVEQIFGYKREELIGKNTDILHKSEENFRKFGELSEPVLSKTGRFKTEWEMKRKDGTIIKTENVITPVKDERGWTEGVVSVIRDITEIKRFELERDLLNEMSQLISESKDSTEATYAVLSKICKVTGWEYGEAWLPNRFDEVLDLGPSIIWDGENIRRFKEKSGKMKFKFNQGLIGRVYSKQKTEWIEDISDKDSNEFRRRNFAEQSGLNIFIGVPIIYEGEVSTVIAFGISGKDKFTGDIIKTISAIASQLGVYLYKQQITTELREHKEKLSQLYTNLQNVRDEERHAISRELHDELGQALTSVRINLTLLDKNLQKNDFDKEKLIGEIRDLGSLVDKTKKNIRKLITSLRTEYMDGMGILDSIEYYGREFSKRTGVDVELNNQLEKSDLDSKSENIVFRVFQEALTNIANHSKADKVELNIYSDNNHFYFDIKDNGIGIRSEDMEKGSSFGLIGIKERIASINGEIDISSQPNKGTELNIKIPVD